MVAPTSASSVEPILTTKLHIPWPGRALVPRHRLLERLGEGLLRRLTLVSAPAGFGKTTLLSEWARSLGAGGSAAAAVAWITLDDGDNDPARLSAYLIAALPRTVQGTGQAAQDRSEVAGPFLQESQLVRLINQIAAYPRALVLILDDYHLIRSRANHDAVSFLIDHLPENLHLVLATRADPPLPLSRLRARGQLVELRQSDLRFTTEEAAVFLNNVMGLRLSAEQVAALEARTEGWIAGLQMAALSLQGHSRDGAARSEFVQAFSGSHRFVLDYLVGEVLEQQPATVQEFLLKTSILERLTGPLCDAVTGSQRTAGPAVADDAALPTILDSQSILEQLEAANLFIVPLDDERRWYRYHRLFADLLRKRLWQASPDLVPTLHRRASEWHEQEGLMAAAIEHALAAHDCERAAGLIEGSVEATLMRSEVATFLNWVDRLPEESVRRRPTLCFYHAWAQLMSGRSLEAVEERLQDMAGARESPEIVAQTSASSVEPMAGRLAALRAYLALFQADVERAAELCRQALWALPASDRFLRGIAAWILSLARLAGGEFQDGREGLEELARVGQESGNPLIAVAALCHHAKLEMRRGRLHRAREILERALHLATDVGGRRLPIASEALIGLGELECEWNELEVAADHLKEGIELAGQWSELAAFDAYFPLARVRLAQGDVEAAREALETARQLALRSKITKVDDRVADIQQASFLVSLGEVEGARQWAERRGLRSCASPRSGGTDLDERHDFELSRADFGELGRADTLSAHLRKYEQLVAARLFLRQGRAAAALDLLESLLAEVGQLGRIDLTIQVQILRALAFQAESEGAKAAEALAEALSLAEPGGYLRVFLDEGEAMAGLLQRALSRGSAQGAASKGNLPGHVTRLLAAFRGPTSASSVEPISAGRAAVPSGRPAQPLVEPLSERELEVLRLLATGLSTPEIAGELVVAVSTVRTHCKSIYGKLNAHRRWDAVQRARDLGLI